MTLYGKEIRADLSDEEVAINLVECALNLALRDDGTDTITVDVEGAKITLNVDFSGVQNEE